jgi:hypothetical protein
LCTFKSIVFYPHHTNDLSRVGFFVLAFLSSIRTTFICSAVVVLRIRDSNSLNCCIDSWTAAGLEAVLAGVSAAGLTPEADTRLSRAFLFQIHLFFFSVISRKVSTDIFFTNVLLLSMYIFM